ncbi:hypothetical protein V8G54_003709, partial [Vigna mungo]
MGPICFPLIYEGNVALVETRPIYRYEQYISYVQNRKVFSVHRNPSTYVDEAEEISLTRQNLYITIKRSWVQRSLEGLSFSIQSFPHNLLLNNSIPGSRSSSQMISHQCGLGHADGRKGCRKICSLLDVRERSRMVDDEIQCKLVVIGGGGG